GREGTWPRAVLDRLRSVAHMVAGVLARRDTDRRLRAALAENEQLRARLERENRYLREQARSADSFGPRAHRLRGLGARHRDLAVPVGAPLPVGGTLYADRRHREGAGELAGSRDRRPRRFHRPVRLLRRARAPSLTHVLSCRDR